MKEILAFIPKGYRKSLKLLYIMQREQFSELVETVLAIVFIAVG